VKQTILLKFNDLSVVLYCLLVVAYTLISNTSDYVRPDINWIEFYGFSRILDCLLIVAQTIISR
ncbi:MAG: hypothetical protein QMD44_07505, partial [Thermodesulfovibrionales bacterium]|nr:hypothetical protein [Thermodesulfovibrionales bacterium]